MRISHPRMMPAVVGLSVCSTAQGPGLFTENKSSGSTDHRLIRYVRVKRTGTGECQTRRYLPSQAISQCDLTIALKSAPKPCTCGRNERAQRSPHHEVCQQAFLPLRKPKRGAACRPLKTLPNHPSPIRPALPTSRRNHPRYYLPVRTGSHRR